MAMEVMIWALNHSRSKHGARLVLISIADNANKDGTGAWPSVKELARKANISPTAVHQAIKNLVELGELEVVEGGGRPTRYGPTNAYRVIMLDYPEPAKPTRRKVTDSDGQRSPTHAETEGLPNHDGYQIGTSDVSAPLLDFADGVPDLAQGVPNSALRGTDSVPRNSPEPSPNRPETTPGASADAAAGDGPTRYPETAQGLVAWWVDHSRQTPPGQMRGHIGKILGRLLAEGIPFASVRTGLWNWHMAEGFDHPSAIPSFVNAVMQGNGRPSLRSVRAGQAAQVTPPKSTREMVL